MARIRYIGEQLIARAFGRTFHRKHWDDDHGLDSDQVATLASNPQFDVEVPATAGDSSSLAIDGEDAG